MVNEKFNQKLLENDNPFPYPEPPRRPPFVIGGERHLNWFKDTYNNRTKQEGTSGVFIVGMPGAGKTHFLRHLDYLFYEANQFKGIYAISTLSDQEIDEKEIWKELFLTPDSTKRLATLIPKEKILSAQIRPDIKKNIINLVDQNLDLGLLSIEAIRKIAEAISFLLPKDSMICIALDNIEEYLSARENDYLTRARTVPEEATVKQKATAEAIKLLVEKIRNMTSSLKKAIVLLALTTPAWAEVRKTEAARTKGRRFKIAEEEQVLTELTLPQCFKLVHEYMKRWCKKEGVELPADNIDCICNLGSENVSIYPFTPMAIELALRTTDQFAGDITCFCSECINSMRNSGQVQVVKDRLTIKNLLRISKEYPWLGWTERARIVLEQMGPIVLEKHLADKLEELVTRVRKKYELGIDTETIASSVDHFANILGVIVSPSPIVENSYNPNAKPIEPSPILKIWSFEEKNIAVRYVIGEERHHIPSASMYGKHVSYQDYVEIMSLIDAEKATHGLMILLWAIENRTKLGMGFARSLREFGNTIKTINLSLNDLYKIIAVTVASEEQIDLARFVDRMFINLTEKVKMLIQTQRPVEKLGEEPKTEKYARYF